MFNQGYKITCDAVYCVVILVRWDRDVANNNQTK